MLGLLCLSEKDYGIIAVFSIREIFDQEETGKKRHFQRWGRMQLST